MRKSRLTNVPKYKRKRPYVYSQIECRVDAAVDVVSLEGRCRHCGYRVVLACNTYSDVTAWLKSLQHDMETKVYEKLSSTQKRKAIAEVEDILGETKTN